MVGGKPLALTEAARDAASPVQESHICKLLANQTSLSIGTIDLTHVASGKEALRRVVEREQRAGRRIIIFDAVSRRDLATIAEVALSMETVPLLAGSAGLAGEVARISSPSGQDRIGATTDLPAHPDRRRQRLRRDPCAVAATSGEELSPPSSSPGTSSPATGRREQRIVRKLARLLGSALRAEAPSSGPLPNAGPAHAGSPTPAADHRHDGRRDHRGAAGGRVDADDLALILTGGDTALVLQLLDYEGIELEGQLIEGIVRGILRGGHWTASPLSPRRAPSGRRTPWSELWKGWKPLGEEGMDCPRAGSIISQVAEGSRFDGPSTAKRITEEGR